MKYNLTFEVAEVNLILQALQELPHKTVSVLVASILTAARAQEAANKAQEEAAAKAVAEEASKSKEGESAAS